VIHREQQEGPLKSSVDFLENLSALVFVASWALEVLPRAIFAEALRADEIRYWRYLKLFSTLFALISVHFGVPTYQDRKHHTDEGKPNDRPNNAVKSKKENCGSHNE
jgi:hypothetical protein